MKLLKATIIIVFSSLFYFSQFYSPQHNWIEVFPLFHWSLFSHRAGTMTDYVVDLPGLETNREQYWLVQELGHAFEERDKNEYVALAQRISQGKPFSLVRREIDPVDYVLNKRVISSKTVVGK